MNEAALYDALESTRPLAAKLAVLSCLPVRVPPALLRLIRLRLVPEGSTGDEGDLWLSDLVETRSAGGFAFRSTVRTYLRARLRGDASLLDDLWYRVHVEHGRWIAPRARLEEELTWRLLRQRDDPMIESLWAGVVQELDAGSNAEGVARWVVRAIPDLPDGNLDHPSGRRAYYGAHLLLGDATVLGHEPQQFLGSSEFGFATRRLPRRRIFVALADGAILVSPLRQIENGHEIDVPATRPLWLQLEPESTSSGGQTVVTIEDNEPVRVETERGVTLRLIDGASYTLRPAPRASTQKFITRNRAPRVQIEYDVELYGAEKHIQLPFVMGVLTDLSGKPNEPLPPVADRKFLEIDVDNFDSRLRALKPRVAFQVPNTVSGEANLSVSLIFESIDDFSPAAVARQTPPFDHLLDARQQLSNLITYMDGKSGAEELVGRLLRDPEMLRSVADGPAAEAPGNTKFEWTLKTEFKPRTDAAQEAVERAVRTLSEQALANAQLIGPDVNRSIEAIIAQLDKTLTDGLNLILHHEDYQKLESAWRGLRYLVGNTETDEMLKIRVLNISKAELYKTLARYQGPDWDQSPVFKSVYEAEYGQFGGEPFGCLVGDYYFDHSNVDVAILGEMSKVCAAAHCPFIASAAPTVMQMQSWQEVANPRDLGKIAMAPEYAAWRSLRESEDARYLALAMPRFLARLPYGAKTDPVEEFDFEEDAGAGDSARYVWANSAYAMAVNINRAFKTYGWCARIRGIESGGAVEGLPTHTFPTDDGGVDMKCPTEIAISDRREAELARCGFMPLVHRKNSDFAAFISAQSLQKPVEYDDPDATAAGALGARLPYLFACCRFAHYLKCIVMDKIGSFRDHEDMRRWLQDWILNYVDGDPANSSEVIRARKPLAAAEILIDEVEGQPGYYSARFFLRPHYQLEGLTVSLRLVARLPSAKAG